MSDLTQRIADSNDEDFSADAIKKMHLLEASAGTGKTYSIQTLYLRLILIEGLTVQQILTVTFTRDATRELRDRLQRVLREALDYLDGTLKIDDPLNRTKLLADAASSRGGGQDAKLKLQIALLDFDTAAIYTIHGFCQRVLDRFAFETKQAFDTEAAGDTRNKDEIEQLCRDWWRKNLYNMDEGIAAFLYESDKFNLEKITKLARRLIAKPDAILDRVQLHAGRMEDGLKAKLKDAVLRINDGPIADDMPEDILKALEKIRLALGSYRQAVDGGKWREAIAALQAAVDIRIETGNPCREAENKLKEACAALKAETLRVNDSFYFDENGNLLHEKKPKLTAQHTGNVRSAVEAFAATIKKWEELPVKLFSSLKSTQALEALEALHNHFLGITGAGLQPDDAAKNIKIISEKSLGLSKECSITTDIISPEFSILTKSLADHPALWVALAIQKQYQANRSTASSVSYDDYLINLRNALKDSTVLPDVLRKEFQAALIDEFQDTDPVQWDIFKKLFDGTGIPCFLVGDPKQAIYRFRNGDVETYLNATGNRIKIPLKKNFRSEKRLIDAVNQIFLDSESRKTFGENIEYKEQLQAEGKAKDKSLIINTNGDVDRKPFKILLIPNSSNNARPPGKYSGSAYNAYRLTAVEIAKILSDKTLKIAGKPVAKKDIAILVNKHEEGDLIARELKALNIPSVRQGTADVWKTDEARNLWIMLEAVINAHDLSRIRNALLSRWCGLNADDILLLNNEGRITCSVNGKDNDYALQDWVGVFDDVCETWLKRGYPAMFRKLSAVFGLKKRLLGDPDRQGQRRLANINHLSEMVEQKIINDRKTPEGVLSWIQRQFDSDTADGGDEVKLRLETDDDAVKIMTVFTSKGLEFPIVFAPTLFMMNPRQQDGIYEYHDEQDENNLHISCKTSDYAKGKSPKEVEKNEMRLENVRKIYVALTRSVHRTVVVALNGRKLVKKDDPPYRMSGVLADVLRLPLKLAEDGEDVVVDLDNVEHRFKNIPGVDCAVGVSVWDAESETEPLVPEEIKGIIDQLPERPEPDKSKGHGSFSSIAGKSKDHATEPDLGDDKAEKKNRDGETVQSSPLTPRDPPQCIFAFPAGARTGTCWHEIFEDLDFFTADQDAIREMTEKKLRIHGFLKKEKTKHERIDLTAAMVEKVLEAQLPQPPGIKSFVPFALNSVEIMDRKTEWEFSFPSLSGKTMLELKNAIDAYDRYKYFAGALGEWSRAIPGGYLTGFVDLLFRKDGCYYIADWKSNRRNCRQEDFNQEGIKEEISLHQYWLQYLIYTVAVHQYLSKSLSGYDYETHFGGVYYIFLRGVDGRKGKDGMANGIYTDRPPLKLVEELSSILGGFS